MLSGCFEFSVCVSKMPVLCAWVFLGWVLCAHEQGVMGFSVYIGVL